MHQLLEVANLGKIVAEMTLIVHFPQIVTYLAHPGTEQLAIDLLSKGIQATIVVKEPPILFLGLAAYQMALVILHPLVKLGGLGLGTQRQQEIVDSHPHGIILVKLDVVIEITVQFTSEVAQDGLEKRVNGTHVEVTVIKQQLIQCQPCQRAHCRLVELGLLHEVGQIIALDAWL